VPGRRLVIALITGNSILAKFGCDLASHRCGEIFDIVRPSSLKMQTFSFNWTNAQGWGRIAAGIAVLRFAHKRIKR